MIVADPFEPMQVAAADLTARFGRIHGWQSGTAADSTEAMSFAQQAGVRAMIEPFPLVDATAALARMMTGKARFRAVLEVHPS